MTRSYNYRGLLIYKNESPEFGTPYFTTVNPRKFDRNGQMLHAHAVSESAAKRIADCFHSLKNGRPGRYSIGVRSKAMRLCGYNILMK